VWRKKVSQQETGLSELYPNLLYFQGHKNRLRGFRNSICCSAGCNISGLGYSSQKGGHRLTFITETYLYWTVLTDFNTCWDKPFPVVWVCTSRFNRL
jgi:hypothetical protein